MFDAERDQERDDARSKAERLSELTEVVGNMRTAYRAYTAETIATFLGGLTDEARQSLEEAFRAYLEAVPGGAVIAARFEGGISWHTVPVVRAAAVKFLPDHCPDFCLIPIAEFAKQQGMEDFEERERESKGLRN